MPDGKRKKFNVYAKTREECEKLLEEMIAEKKAESPIRIRITIILKTSLLSKI